MPTPHLFIQFYQRVNSADGEAEISQTMSLCQSVHFNVGDCILCVWRNVCECVCAVCVSVGVSSSELSAWHNVGAMIDGWVPFFNLTAWYACSSVCLCVWTCIWVRGKANKCLSNVWIKGWSGLQRVIVSAWRGDFNRKSSSFFSLHLMIWLLMIGMIMIVCF